MIPKMKLSELENKNFMDVVRDGEFESLAFVRYNNHNNPNQFTYVEDARHLRRLLSTPNMSCVITSRDLAPRVPQELGLAVASIPRKAFFDIHNYLANETNFYWEPFPSEVAGSSSIHPRAYVAENNVRIGPNCIIGSHASILEGSILESDVIIGPGSVIGGEGFQFIRFEKEILSVTHAGGVLIHKGVEIQANSVVDKAVFRSFTTIGEYTKIDNLVHVGHNVAIGKRCMIVACAQVGGNSAIGDDVWIGPSASISSKITIGSGAWVSIGSVVTMNVGPGKKVTGNFAIDHEKFIANMVRLTK